MQETAGSPAFALGDSYTTGGPGSETLLGTTLLSKKRVLITA